MLRFSSPIGVLKRSLGEHLYLELDENKNDSPKRLKEVMTCLNFVKGKSDKKLQQMKKNQKPFVKMDKGFEFLNR